MTATNTTTIPPVMVSVPGPLPKPPGQWASITPPTTTKTLRVGAGQQFATVDQAFAAATNGTAIELARGETFPTVGIKVTKNDIILRAFGTSTLPLPILVGQGASKEFGNIIEHAAAGMLIENIHFDDNDVDTKFTAVAAAKSNLTVQNCLFNARLFRGVFVSGAAVGFRIFKCAAPQGMNTYMVYTGDGSQFVEVEHCFCPNSINEHCVRTHSSHVRILDNDFMMKVRQDGSIKACINVRQGIDAYIAFNRCTGCQVLILGPLASETTKELRNVIVEHNIFKEERQCQIFEGAENVTIRSNTFERHSNSGTIFNVMPSVVSRPAPSGLIEKNTTKGTAFINGDTSRFIFKSKGNTLNGAQVT